MSEREYIKYNTSIQVASNSGTLQKDDEGNLAAIVELRLPDNIFPAESGKKKVDSVQMLTTKMRISMENTPIAQFDVDEDTMTKLEKLNKGSNAAFITTSQLDLYPYVIKGDNQILPVKSNSAFPRYRTQILRIDVAVWMGENYISLDTLYVHPLSHTSFAENIGRYQEPFQKVGVFAAVNHLSNLVVKQYMPVKRENDIVSIYNVGSIEQMLQDGIESAFVYNNTGFNEALQYSIFLISEDAYNNNHFPPVEDDDFTKEDVDTENTMIIEEMGGIKAFFVNKIFGPDYIVQEREISNLRYSVKPKVSFTEQKLRISYDTCPFVNNIPILWCNSYINTYDNPLQLTMGELYSEYSDGFKPPKRVYSYGVTKNEDNSYFFALQQSTINPINIVGNKDLRETFSCLPWITVDTNTNGFFKSKTKAKYRINEQTQVKTNITSSKVLTVTRPSQAPSGTNWRHFKYGGRNCTSIDSALTANCLVYSFKIPMNEVITTGATFNEKYPKAKRTDQTVDWGTETRLSDVSITVNTLESRNVIGTSETFSEQKTYNQYEYNYNESLPSTEAQEIYTSTSLENTDLPISKRQPCCGYFYIDGNDTMLIYEVPEGEWNSGSAYKCWIPPIEPDFVSEPVLENNNTYALNAYWNLPQDDIHCKTVLVAASSQMWWSVTYEQEVEDVKTYYKQNVIETLTAESIDNLLFNFLPNVDLDEKGRFYLLDGTTTNLSMGQQEVIEGPMNSLYDITTNTRITHHSRSSNETWNGTKDGVPYIQILNRKYNVMGIPQLIYRYFLIDSSQPDIPSNRTRQFIYYDNVNMENLVREDVQQVISHASLQNSSGTVGPLSFEDHETHETSSSTEYPIGETVLPVVYTNWHVVNSTQTILSDEETIVSINTLAETVTYLENSSDTYWRGDAGLTGNPLYRCIPTRNSDRSEILDENEFFQAWYFTQNSDFPLFVRKQITSSNSIEEEREQTNTTITVVDNNNEVWYGNIRLNFEWDNIPIVVISPIQSIVLTLQGMNVSQEFQPINVAQAGGSSLTSTIPVIENYYSLAQTIRDLHDELVVIKDSYDDQPCYSLSSVDGQARALRLEAHYITKDGRLHQIYIPPNGVFSLQLTFGISYYFTS